ncbi:MAG: Stp1/IreP family PP2C-type Ser/Thr phosphatase [Gammaproteobacteria bacterium]|mgnify:FL=1|jgi:protein phosphatase|nr:Stp1/IreP family PP2C-type Ser/Thr phosphatase [Gammaproteobacteria bacterium]HJO12647.1 Stp1/IreP family PP2C-type Ser/Thr phosphatase [Gammaproteobacteria bacterium]|tara:strand:- start:4186 stop:4959 length:774 start_codon:yes stop_codon:yes gene_type:complete
MIKIAGFTDAGLSRSHNEDTIGFNQQLGIAVLADGMGGHKAGEVASKIAVDTVLERLKKLFSHNNSGSITGSQLLDFVSTTISSSNSKIYQASAANSARSGMGTTLVAAVVKGSHMYAGHVGDSRLYLFRKQKLTRITRDHSLVQDLIDKGFYTEKEARNAKLGHIVTRILGTEADVEVDTLQQDLESDDLLLMCSDGLSDMLSDAMIGDILSEGPANLDDTARELVSKANQHGGKDNISVILVQVMNRTLCTNQTS